MTRDYAKKQPAKRRNQPVRRRSNKKQSGVPGWVWLLAGILLGLLISTLIQLAKLPETEVEQASESSSEPAEPQQKPKQKPKFDFYTLLRETEVIVPEGPETEREIRESGSDTIFLLQAGSFKRKADADSLRASLLLLNLSAKIETFNASNGETWHRVLVGPFDNNSQVASARGKLASNGIEFLLLKRKK